MHARRSHWFVYATRIELTCLGVACHTYDVIALHCNSDGTTYLHVMSTAGISITKSKHQIYNNMSRAAAQRAISRRVEQYTAPGCVNAPMPCNLVLNHHPNTRTRSHPPRWRQTRLSAPSRSIHAPPSHAGTFPAAYAQQSSCASELEHPSAFPAAACCRRPDAARPDLRHAMVHSLIAPTPCCFAYQQAANGAAGRPSQSTAPKAVLVAPRPYCAAALLLLISRR